MWRWWSLEVQKERIMTQQKKFLSLFFIPWLSNVTDREQSGPLSQLRPHLYGEKLSRVKGSPSYPSYPGRANFSYISLQNFTNRLHEKQKADSAGRVTRLAGSPSFNGTVTVLAGPTFLHINTLARPAGSTQLRRDDQSVREHCSLRQRVQLFSHINAR